MKWKVALVRWKPPETAPATETLLLDSFEAAAYLIKKTYERDADLHHVYVRMINKILTALAVCLADQYGETVTAAAVEEGKTA